MEHFFLRKVALVFVTCALLVACKEKKSLTVELPQIPAEEISGDHQWYYITSRGLERCALPQRAVLQLLRPWTENLRVSDAATSSEEIGYMLVNRLGVLVFEQSGEPVILQDVQLFGESTAENLVFDGVNPYFTLYKSTFFNKSALVSAARSEKELNRPFVVRVAPENKMLYPVVTYGDLDLADGGEVTGSFFNGDSWLVSIKTTSESETDFRYLAWKPVGELQALMPTTKPGKLEKAESTEDDYRACFAEQPLESAPERLQHLLATLPENFSYQVSYKFAGGTSAQSFVVGEEAVTQANAVLAPGWICAIFADGTSYFNGALLDRPLVADGATVAFRLPKLPKNYFYTDFCLTGDYLVVGWEERDFYKTARSGILVVDMGQLFYNKPSKR